MQNPTFEKGDHLITPRGLYTHHGLYAGDGKVIAYEGYSQVGKTGPVRLFTLEEFSGGHPIYIRRYTPKQRRFSREESVARAREKIGEDGYNLWKNNCEHFVSECITGKAQSRQISAVKWGIITLAALTLGIAHRHILAKKSNK